MPDHPARPSGSRLSWVLRWTERLLIIAGAAVLVWCGAIVSDAVIAQRHAHSALQAATRQTQPLRRLPVRASGIPSAPALVSRGAAIGALSIPRVHLSAVVLHGSDAQTLRRGPGHLETSALPGESGNVVIAGHRDSFFWPLRDIQLNDDIILDTPRGQFHYRVAWVRVVKPNEVSVLAATGVPALTLITCYPFWVFGHAPDRFVVRAVAVAPGDVMAVTSVDTRGPTRLARADDEVLARLAVERYRHQYNGRLINRHEVGANGLMKFEHCDVVVTGDRATAVCQSALPSSATGEPASRTFTLSRAAGGWALMSVVVQ